MQEDEVSSSGFTYIQMFMSMNQLTELVRGYKQTHRYAAKYLVDPKARTIMKVKLIFLWLSVESRRSVEDAIVKDPYILNLENVLISMFRPHLTHGKLPSLHEIKDEVCIVRMYADHFMLFQQMTANNI
jgi:hypothetical protein